MTGIALTNPGDASNEDGKSKGANLDVEFSGIQIRGSD